MLQVENRTDGSEVFEPICIISYDQIDKMGLLHFKFMMSNWHLILCSWLSLIEPSESWLNSKSSQRKLAAPPTIWFRSIKIKISMRLINILGMNQSRKTSKKRRSGWSLSKFTDENQLRSIWIQRPPSQPARKRFSSIVDKLAPSTKDLRSLNIKYGLKGLECSLVARIVEWWKWCFGGGG